MSMETISEIVAFWLGPAQESPEAAMARRDWWYDGGPAVDTAIGHRFGAQVEKACRGKLQDWQVTPDGALALVLLLDQFTRNLYRHSPAAYSGDHYAFEIVNRAIAAALDRELHPVSRIWLYHPFHHSESIEQQDKGVTLLHDIAATAPDDWQPYIRRSIAGWGRHRDIVARFGRFPHRNQVLGRASTEEELDFLATNEERFGQGPRHTSRTNTIVG